MKNIKLLGLDGTKSILEKLNEESIYINADCGGNGSCGKCEVIIDGELKLACKTYPVGDIEIVIPTKEENIRTETAINFARADGTGKGKAICVDIGTTTVAAVLVEKRTGVVLDNATCVNHQRAFGADVISRIAACSDGKADLLSASIRKDVNSLLRKLSAEEDVDDIVISGNTTMEHIYCGYPCEGLGKNPYTPFNIGLTRNKKEIILPGISTFVGADIAAGIVAVEMDKSDEVVALIDLGTNGEMAIGNKDKIMVTSTAAGPAFEGGNISSGMASVSGAISKVEIVNDKVCINTLDEKTAIGICGTGVVDTVAELVKNQVINKTGLMRDEFFDEGFSLTPEVRFTQKDVRQVQMAKAAIRAGLQVLAQNFGAEISQIKTLYIAGGFGQKVDVKKSAEIGMIPMELCDRTVAVGNSSLAGAVTFICNGDSEERFLRICNEAIEVNLAENIHFNELYMKYMGF